MPEVNSVVAVCDNRSQAEETLTELQKAGFDITKVSAVGDAKTERVFLICDVPWTHPIKKLTSHQARGKGTKTRTAA